MNKITRLKKQHLQMFESKREAHRQRVGRLYQEYVAQTDAPSKCRAALYSGFYHYFAKNFKPEIYEDEAVVGTCWHWCWSGCCPSGLDTPSNMGHFTADYASFLSLGISGKRALLEQTDASASPWILSALEAFSQYIRAYADEATRLAEQTELESERFRLREIAENCEWISENPPQTFTQALQLVWFIHCFLETESNNAALSFGRIDQALYPYYRHDLEKGVVSREKALELIMCFYIKTSEGDESQMLTVSGDAENELSCLFIEAQQKVDMRQPSIGLVLSENTSVALMEAAKKLALNGGGMPAFFNADIIVKGLQNIGIQPDDAKKFAIVGCYEASPQGAFSNTVASGFNLYDSFSEFVRNAEEYHTFDEFLQAWKKHYDLYYQTELLPAFQKNLRAIQSHESPFAACALEGCAEKGLFPEQGGCKYFLYGLNILGIGLVIDSLNTIRELVFERNFISLKELYNEAESHFSDKTLERIKSIDNYYGSNSPQSNRLAKEVSAWVAQVATAHPLCEGVIVSPALFQFTADIWQRDYKSTLNGRKQGELLSYGVMPCATPHSLETSSILLSTANIASDRFPNGCPVMIAASKKELEQVGFMESVLRAYFKAGGFQLAVNAVNAELLEKARKKPQEHTDVMVKISGYSAQFTGLHEKIQDAVIERAHRDE